MEEFLRYVICQLVEHPDEVVISRTDAPGRVTFHVAMRKADLPRIIGKGGHTIRALRALLNASGTLKHLKTNLEIIE